MENIDKDKGILFDDNDFYGATGEKLARMVLEENGINDATEEQLFKEAMFLKEETLYYQMLALKAWFDGEASNGGLNNPAAGNHILVAGSASWWNGSSTGIDIYQNFESVIDTSPSRFGCKNIFADCEFTKSCDDNGHLYISGAHHDGGVSVEIRQLSEEGEKLLCETLDYNGEVDLYDLELEAMGNIYKEGDENKFVHDLWNNPDFCPACLYVERSWK